jgi:hypothetical protein
MATMTDTSSLRDYLDEFGELPGDSMLGRLTLTTINDGKYRFDDIERWFKDLGLNQAMMPAKNKPVDAFRKATSDVNGREYDLPNGTYAEMLCRDVALEDAYVRRQITREIRDTRKRKLHYHEAISCTFYRATTPGGGGERLVVSVRRDNLLPDEISHVEEVGESIRENFLAYYQYLDGNKVRGVVRKYLKHLNAIEIKGGVYFVHKSRAEELDRLAEFVSRLGNGCHMGFFPIVDLKAQRELVTAAFEREAAQSLQEITREAKQLLETRKSITPAMYEKMRVRFDTVLANANEHMSTLEVSQDVTAASAEAALRMLGALREEMLNS